MGVIKGVLKEELERSQLMLKRYQEEIAKVKGCLVKKRIGRRDYCYLAKREGGKVRFVYKGPLSAEIRRAYKAQRALLSKYRGFVAKLKEQIRFLRRSLRGKESV